MVNYEDVRIQLNSILKNYESTLKEFLCNQLKKLKNLPELPESVDTFDTFDTSFENEFFTISEEERQKNNLGTFEDVNQNFLNQAKASVKTDGKLDSNFIIGVWEKICEYFFWILEYLARLISTTGQDHECL